MIRPAHAERMRRAEEAARQPVSPVRRAVHISAMQHRMIMFGNGYGWMEHGIMLGYPPCCIAAFLCVAPGDRNYEIPEAYKDTGFIPCKSCAQADPQHVLSFIAANRRWHEPFPEFNPKD